MIDGVTALLSGAAVLLAGLLAASRRRENAAVLARVAESLQSSQQRTQERQANAQREEQLAAARDTFFANSSHEFRTPLNGMMGLADSLLTGGEAFSPRVEQALQAIVSSGKRMNRLISDLLDHTKAQTGVLSIDLRAVDVNVAVSEAMLLLAPMMGEKSIQFINDISANFPLVRADETRLAQVLAHILGNALVYSSEGEIRVSAERHGTQITVTVTDTGPGIADAEGAQLFNAARPNDGSPPRGTESRGFGLAFVKTLIELQHGTIGFSSEVGRGSSFFFTLPEAGPGAQRRREPQVRTISPTTYRSSIPGMNAALRRVPMPNVASEVRVNVRQNAGEPQPRQPPSSRYNLRHAAPPGLLLAIEPGAPASSKGGAAPESGPVSIGLGGQSLRPGAPTEARAKILVVDDDATNRERFDYDLEALDCDITCAADGAEALEVYRTKGPFSVVILDVMMPGIDGMTVCRELRKLPSGRQLPVVLVTANHEEKTLTEGFAAGASDFVTKPYKTIDLLERVRLQLRNAAMARAIGRVVPQEFLSLLGHKTIDRIRLGDCTEKHITILFCDIQGFTEVSENRTPRQVFTWLNERFGAIVPCFRTHGGFVDKFIGDAVLALFDTGVGAALQAATEAAQAMRLIDDQARLGIGVYHGQTMIGIVGETERFSPTVVSDSVNVASRLEALTRRFDSSVLTSEETLTQLPVQLWPATRYLGAFRVKGRHKALRIYELLDAETAEVAAAKRGAASALEAVVASVARGDLGNAARAAALGLDDHPTDGALAFYLLELDRVGGAAVSNDGVINLDRK